VSGYGVRAAKPPLFEVESQIEISRELISTNAKRSRMHQKLRAVTLPPPSQSGGFATRTP
jgi:hypothetical protein